MNWYFYAVWLLISSVITFVLYGVDKNQAKAGGNRVPEKVLHFLALSGGFPGGWAGRSLFRHKTKKASFAFVLVLSTAIHLGLVWWLLLR